MMEKRDVGKKILEGIDSIRKGWKEKYIISRPEVLKVRHQLHLSQSVFAAYIGIRLRTLQEWEQGRRKSSGPNSILPPITQKHPEPFFDL